jgi:hypothetical protein
MQPISTCVGVGDIVDDVGMISGVDYQPITDVVLIGDAPSVMPECMAEDNVAFGDE